MREVAEIKSPIDLRLWLVEYPEGVSRSDTAANMRSLLLTLLAIATIVSGCAAPVMHGDPSSMDTAHPHSIYVVRQPWHTGIVVLAADVPANAWLARRDFPDAAYLEVGWGDRAYYQAADPGVWLGLRALFWPTPGVLHVAAFNGPVERTFGSTEILELRVSARGLARLVEVVRDSHELDASGRPIALGPGLYGASRFYASRETFHLFKTCNVWTASVLLEAGIPVSPGLAFSAGNLMTQLRPSGRVIRPAQAQSNVAMGIDNLDGDFAEWRRSFSE